MPLMLPADPARHRDGVRAMVTARVAWLRGRGLSAPEGIAETLAGQVGEPEWPVWVLAADGTVVGCTTVLSECPAWAFTSYERGRPWVFLASTWTLPSADRFGRLIARWALDYAAWTGPAVREARGVPLRAGRLLLPGAGVDAAAGGGAARPDRLHHVPAR